MRRAAGSKGRRPRQEPARRLRVGYVAAPVIVAGVAMAAILDRGPGEPPAVPPPQVERSLVAHVVPMPICGSGRRVTCVVDGDTFWIAREKVRLEGIDAPELAGQCEQERLLARRAKRRLSELLSGAPFSLTRSGSDRYGRTLARVETPRGEAGEILLREGLARPWRGRRENWCGSA